MAGADFLGTAGGTQQDSLGEGRGGTTSQTGWAGRQLPRCPACDVAVLMSSGIGQHGCELGVILLATSVALSLCAQEINTSSSEDGCYLKACGSSLVRCSTAVCSRSKLPAQTSAVQRESPGCHSLSCVVSLVVYLVYCPVSFRCSDFGLFEL